MVVVSMDKDYKGWCNGPMKITSIIISLLLMLAGCASNVIVEPPKDMVAVHQPGDSSMSCAELDLEIGMLYQQALAKAPPGFLEDQGSTSAAFIGTFAFAPSYLYLLHNELVDKPKDQMRVNAMLRRIEVLQRYKASKHCFEHS